jgi:hydroxymethylpyrimidine/phosphomethylpyrimidine kinase
MNRVTARTVLVIAGFDPSGGAGVTADLKVVSSFGACGVSVITALTVQNTRGVSSVHPVDPGVVRAQMYSLLEDIEVHAVKIGMLGSPAVAKTVASVLSGLPAVLPVVLDPVLVSTSGAGLAGSGGLKAIIRELLPISTVVTPNLSEASALSGIDVQTIDDMKAAARIIAGKGAGSVLVKGGHLPDGATDVLYHDGAYRLFKGKRYPAAVHGTGCRLSSAIAANIALGSGVPEAVGKSKRHLSCLFRSGVIRPGSGALCFK